MSDMTLRLKEINYLIKEWTVVYNFNTDCTVIKIETKVNEEKCYHLCHLSENFRPEWDPHSDLCDACAVLF